MQTKIARIMSCNLRVDTPADGINCFDNRKERLRDAILEAAPDVIGFQEAREHMRDWLRENLTEYTILGCGRKDDYMGEGIPVAYRTRDFELLSFETRWLSLTPNVPGSRYEEDQSPCPRIYHVVRLVKKGMDKPLCVINVHTDHRGSQARVLGVRQMLAECQCYAGENIAITGDFNALPKAPEICMMTEECGVLGLQDASVGLEGTFHGYGKTSEKIDYIFTNRAYANSTRLHPVFEDGIYLSDHDPIFTDLLS